MATITKEELKKLFDEIDVNKDNKLSQDEFTKFANSYASNISQKDIRNIFKHMSSDNGESVNFEEFYVWWSDGKEKKLLPVLYFKKQIDQILSDASAQIQKQKSEISDEKPSHQKCDVTLCNGQNNKETHLALRFCTHKEAETNADVLKKLLGLGNQPTVVLKIKAAKDIDEAYNNLEDLVEQAKQIVECMLPIEYSEQYLKLVDIKVHKDKTHLYLSVSSNNSVINQIYSSYQTLVDQLNLQDQSISFEAAYSSSLNFKTAMEKQSSLIFNELLSHINLDLHLSASSVVLDNLRYALYQTIDSDLKKNQGQAFKRNKAKEYALVVIGSLLNGISVKLNAEQFEKLIPEKLNTLTFQELTRQFKVSGKQEEVMSLPIIQDAIQYFNEYTLSDLNIQVFGPGLFADLHFKADNISSLLNLFFAV